MLINHLGHAQEWDRHTGPTTNPLLLSTLRLSTVHGSTVHGSTNPRSTTPYPYTSHYGSTHRSTYRSSYHPNPSTTGPHYVSTTRPPGKEGRTWSLWVKQLANIVIRKMITSKIIYHFPYLCCIDYRSYTFSVACIINQTNVTCFRSKTNV